MADDSGLSGDAIGLLERGERRRPQRKTVLKLADALGLEASRRASFIAAAGAAPPSPRSRAARGPVLASSSKLPAPISSFVGRRSETAALEQVLRRARLVTLTGFGGVGKTRLALHVASRLERHFAGGVWLVDFTSYSNAGSVDDAMRSALEIDAGVPTVADALAERQERGPMLLILDNCERLIEDVARAAQTLLTRVAGATVLCTSRQALQLQGEHTFQVGFLPMPTAPMGSIRELRRYEAAELFLDRFISLNPTIRLDDTAAPTIADIVTRLDGIPLALEFGAARANETSLTHLRQELSEGFGTLRERRRFAAAHHTTMDATIDWSYRLLSRQERAALRCLSAFNGGWTLESAAVVCSAVATTAERVSEILQSLVAKSLVEKLPTDAQVRYRALEPVREFAASRLARSRDASTVSGKHAHYFLAIVRDLSARWLSSTTPPPLTIVLGEMANLRSAREWLLASGQADLAAELVAKSAWFVNYIDAGDGERAIRRMLSVVGGSGTLYEGYLLSEFGWRDHLEPGERRSATERAVAVLRQYDDPQRLCRALYLLARVVTEHFPEERSYAEALCREAIELALRPAEVGNVLMVLAFCVDPTDVALQRRLMSESCTELARVSAAAHSVGLRCWAEFEVMHGDAMEGIAMLQHARTLGEDGKLRESVLGCNADLSVAYAMIGDSDAAIDYIKQTRNLAAQLENPMYVAYACQALAHVALDAGDAVTAARLFGSYDARVGRVYPAFSTLDCQYAEHRRLSERLAQLFDGATLRRHVADGAALPVGDALAQGIAALQK